MIDVSNLVIEQQILSLNQMPFQADLNIAFAIDKNYLKPCGICIYSILKHNPNLNIDFHIFTTYFDATHFKALLTARIRIHVHILKPDYFDSLQTTGHFTTAIYYRLSIAHILKDQVKSFLYVDADILCTGSLDDLTTVSLDHAVLGAVQDSSMKLEDITGLGLPNTHRYFNSGVLLIHCKHWLDFDVVEKFTQLIGQREYEYPDQDVLNLILEGHIEYLDEKFNYFSENDIQPVLMHFVSTPKPWSICAMNNALYLKYYAESPWQHEALNPPRNYKEEKKYAKKLWKNKEYLHSLQWFYRYTVHKLNQ